MLVVDASALAAALLGRSADARSLRRRIAAAECHAPYLIDAEVGNVLRRRVLRGGLAAPTATSLLAAATPLIDYRYEMTGGLALAAWAVRDNVSFYDGLYAALASLLGCPLLSADGRLGNAPGLRCRVELVPAGT
ncbi:MAG TPA: PIN domain-containing protein [Streptosporangiaceae bacterium]|nr:PIN domain-containing protein [Streptosporangiaceae bacterium]